MLIVQISVIIVTFLSFISHILSLMQTAAEANPIMYVIFANFDVCLILQY